MSAGVCPFCDFSDPDTYILMLHVETLHSEGRSPFALHPGDTTPSLPRPQASAPIAPGLACVDAHDQFELRTAARATADDDDERYVICPEVHCGEAVQLAQLNSHLDMHVAEKLTVEDLAHDMNRREWAAGEAEEDGRRSDTEHDAMPDRGWRAMFSSGGQATSISGHRRLGKSQLGPHAYEKQMPASLRRLLETGGTVTIANQLRPSSNTYERVVTVSNEARHVMPVLAQLCEHDPSVERVYLCDPSVRHVFKLKGENGFCGYRNIQMLISWIVASAAPGWELFAQLQRRPDASLGPDVLQLQDLIEQAWDMGFNPAGRIETGGVRGTRKYIGTPEAQAVFQSLGIPCTTLAYSKSRNTEAVKACPPHERLLSAIEDYFTRDAHLTRTIPAPVSGSGKVTQTNLPPIYFQHSGHSMTIVGIERLRTPAGPGHHHRLNLLVFDPMFQASPAMACFIGENSGGGGGDNSSRTATATARRFLAARTSAMRPLSSSSSSSSRPSSPTEVLKAYRRGEAYLKRYSAFETLTLSPPTRP